MLSRVSGISYSGKIGMEPDIRIAQVVTARQFIISEVKSWDFTNFQLRNSTALGFLNACGILGNKRQMQGLACAEISNPCGVILR